MALPSFTREISVTPSAKTLSLDPHHRTCGSRFRAAGQQLHLWVSSDLSGQRVGGVGCHKSRSPKKQGEKQRPEASCPMRSSSLIHEALSHVLRSTVSTVHETLIYPTSSETLARPYGESRRAGSKPWKTKGSRCLVSDLKTGLEVRLCMQFGHFEEVT